MAVTAACTLNGTDCSVHREWEWLQCAQREWPPPQNTSAVCAAAVTMMQVKTELKEHETKEGKNALQQVDSCWALRDCCANMENALPALAQVEHATLHPYGMPCTVTSISCQLLLCFACTSSLAWHLPAVSPCSECASSLALTLYASSMQIGCADCV